MTTSSDERPETWKAVPEIEGCTFSGYRVSDKGSARSVDRVVKGRRYPGTALAARPDRDGYVLITIRCDSTDPDHDRRHTFLMHKLVLTTFDKPCPPGMEGCHDPARGPAFNWWPEGVRWDTKPANEADKPGPPAPPEPQYPCLNAPRCPELAVNENRRCQACAEEMGRQCAALLEAGMNSIAVAEVFGVTERWAYEQAVRHGGYAGTRAEARAQHPTMGQRAVLRVRFRSLLRQAAAGRR